MTISACPLLQSSAVFGVIANESTDAPSDVGSVVGVAVEVGSVVGEADEVGSVVGAAVVDVLVGAGEVLVSVGEAEPFGFINVKISATRATSRIPIINARMMMALRDFRLS